MYFVSTRVFVSLSSGKPLKMNIGEHGHLHPVYKTGFPVGDEIKDWPSNDSPGTLHLQPGLSCCPVLAAQMCSECADTACERTAAADTCIDTSRAERNLTENQQLWELWRRLSLAVLSECCWMVVMFTHGIEPAQPHWDSTTLGPSGVSLTRVKPRLVLGFKEEAVSYQARQQAFWGSADLWKKLAVCHYYSEWFTSCCKNISSLQEKITTTIGHHSSLCSSHQPSDSFCVWECYKHAKNSLWTWGNNADNMLLVLWGKILIEIINNLR